VPWGGVEAQWHRTLFSRLRPWLPARTILEIAPGYGRWTHFLKDHCRQLIAVDVAERCVAACRQRFADCPHVEVYVNDGRSLDAVADGSVDLAFSFDSLVHADEDVIDGYVLELSRKLAPEGAGFIHHSNLRRYAAELAGGEMGNPDWRAESMDAARFEGQCEAVGLACIAQEQIVWGDDEVHLRDCLSTFVPRSSRRARPNEVLENHDFMAEARQAQALAPLYFRPER
jgi:SAM-dependent methyltransferase